MAAPDFPQPCHIGDGVYVSFDGYQLWLAANHHENKVVALDPFVVAGLIRFCQEINRAVDRPYFPVVNWKEPNE